MAADLSRCTKDFFLRDVLEIAPQLPGCFLVRRQKSGIQRYRITEAEAYRGEEDRACHAWRGRTIRTEAMYSEGGHLYVYLIYGMYWMLNIVTGLKDQPQAALIRGVEGMYGPGRLTRLLNIDKSFNGEDILTSDRLWLEYGTTPVTVRSFPRIGIDYAGEPWLNKLWRFTTEKK